MPHFKYRDGKQSPIMIGQKIMPDAETLTLEIVKEGGYRGVKWEELQIPREILLFGHDDLFVYMRAFHQMDPQYINFFPSLMKSK